MAGIVLRAITDGEFGAFRETLSLVFGEDVTEESKASLRAWLELDRTLAAFDGELLVATGGALSFGLVVPGGATIGAAGVTVVSVRTTHRRQGVLTEMMRRQLDDVADRGEPVAVLRASESTIYGRFGYGCAITAADLSIERHRAALRPDAPPATGTVRLVELDEARRLYPQVYAAATIERALPGSIVRRDADWTAYFEDPESDRNRASAKRYAVYENGDGEATGYVRYRHRPSWNSGGPDGAILVSDIQAVDVEALAALLTFTTSVDLTVKVEFDLVPTDGRIADLLADPRRLQGRSYDLLWVRLVDVATALSARRYRVPGSVVVEVVDALTPERGGVFRIEGGPGDSSCRRVDEPPEVRVDTADLAAAYLGDSRLRLLAWAGRVTGDPAAIALLDDMMSWGIPPATSVRF